MKFTKVGRKTIAAWKAHPRYISSCGGTRSGKTYSILQTFILALVEEVNKGKPATINSVVSESMPHLQRGAIRDFKQIMEVEGLWEDARWNETQHTYTWSNGSILEFFSVDNAGKVHGSARDRLYGKPRISAEVAHTGGISLNITTDPETKELIEGGLD